MNHATMALSKALEFESFETEAGNHKNAIKQMCSLLADHHIKRLAL